MKVRRAHCGGLAVAAVVGVAAVADIVYVVVAVDVIGGLVADLAQMELDAAERFVL